MDTLGQRLKSAREGALLTQAELSQRAGVAIVTISRLETGDSADPRPGTIKRLAAALDMDAGVLMWGGERGARATKSAGKG